MSAKQKRRGRRQNEANYRPPHSRTTMNRPSRTQRPKNNPRCLVSWARQARERETQARFQANFLSHAVAPGTLSGRRHRGNSVARSRSANACRSRAIPAASVATGGRRLPFRGIRALRPSRCRHPRRCRVYRSALSWIIGMNASVRKSLGVQGQGGSLAQGTSASSRAITRILNDPERFVSPCLI